MATVLDSFSFWAFVCLLAFVCLFVNNVPGCLFWLGSARPLFEWCPNGNCKPPPKPESLFVECFQAHNLIKYHHIIIVGFSTLMIQCDSTWASVNSASELCTRTCQFSRRRRSFSSFFLLLGFHALWLERAHTKNKHSTTRRMHPLCLWEKMMG